MQNFNILVFLKFNHLLYYKFILQLKLNKFYFKNKYNEKK